MLLQPSLSFESTIYFLLFFVLLHLFSNSVLFLHITFCPSSFIILPPSLLITPACISFFLPYLYPHTSSNALTTHPKKYPQKLASQFELILVIFLHIFSSSYHHSAKLTFFTQYMSFSLHSLSSYQLMLPLVCVINPHGLPLHIAETTGVVLLLTQSQFLSHFLPVCMTPSSFPLS